MNQKKETIAGIVLAGGRSSRMGQNKALLPIGDMTAVERVIKKTAPFSDEQLLITNDLPAFSFLNINMTEDMRPYEGPLAGLETAMHHVFAEWYFLTACDMPLIQTSVLKYLSEFTGATEADAVIPEIEGRQHPLLALYRRKALPEVTACLSSNRRSVQALLDTITFDTVTENDMIKGGVPDTEIASSFYNMNRPDEYEWILRQF